MPGNVVLPRPVVGVTAVAGALFLVACGGGEEATPTPAPSPTPIPVCELAWNPDSLDFGTVLTRERVSLDATLEAVGTLDCVVRDVEIEGPASKQFSIASAPDLPRTLLPGGTGLTFTFEFHPSYPGTFDAYVVMESEDRDAELALLAVGYMPDEDGDLVDDRDDNCPGLANPDQWDWDDDGIGDDCDECPRDPENDVDGDQVCGNRDNCPETANPDQGDSDQDFLGDACDWEDCDGRDNDGDGLVDEDFVDADGIGGADCHDDDGDGVSEEEGDCDDTDATVYPGAVEAWYDGRDSDCDGVEDPDPCDVLPSAREVPVTTGCSVDLEVEFVGVCMPACEEEVSVVGAVLNHGSDSVSGAVSLSVYGVMEDGSRARLTTLDVDGLAAGFSSEGLSFPVGTFHDIEVYDHLSLEVSGGEGVADCDPGNDAQTVPLDTLDCAEPDYCEVGRAGYPNQTDPDCSIILPWHRVSAVVRWQKQSFSEFPEYNQAAVTPMVGNLTDDNGDGRIDANDTPDIVFVTFYADEYEADGVLRVISGDDGHEVWSATGVYALSGAALGDADADGCPEVYAMSTDGDLVAFACDGTRLWTCPAAASPATYPAVADLEGDGDAEILAGRTVCDHEGNVVVTTDLVHTSETTFFEDLDQDGVMEIVSGAGVSAADGTTLWTGPGGHAAVADFDADQSPELAVVHDNDLELYDDDGTLLWSSIVFEGGDGPPTIGDFDNDGAPEIGLGAAHFYLMFDGDGTLVWNASTVDEVSQQTVATVYDLDGDGTSEVVYADQTTFWILDGATGQVRYQNENHASRTMQEYPVIVDLDGDRRAEVVLTSGDFGFGGWTGLTVLEDSSNNWVTARPVWNQHAYRPSHVADDLSIPARPDATWIDGENGFRQGGSGELLPYDVPDLVPVLVARCEADCPRSSGVVFQVRNSGLGEAEAPIPFAIYGVEADGGEFAIVTGAVDDPIPAGWTSASIEVTLDDDQIMPFVALKLRIDDDGSGPGEENECDETNNALELPWPCQ